MTLVFPWKQVTPVEWRASGDYGSHVLVRYHGGKGWHAKVRVGLEVRREVVGKRKAAMRWAEETATAMVKERGGAS